MIYFLFRKLSTANVIIFLITVVTRIHQDLFTQEKTINNTFPFLNMFVKKHTGIVTLTSVKMKTKKQSSMLKLLSSRNHCAKSGLRLSLKVLTKLELFFSFDNKETALKNNFQYYFQQWKFFKKFSFFILTN